MWKQAQIVSKKETTTCDTEMSNEIGNHEMSNLRQKKDPLLLNEGPVFQVSHLIVVLPSTQWLSMTNTEKNYQKLIVNSQISE